MSKAERARDDEPLIVVERSYQPDQERVRRALQALLAQPDGQGRGEAE